MSNSIDRIRALIGVLPTKDITLGYKFLDSRDFESLKELVDSAIYKVRKNLKKDNPREDYLNISLEDLSRLKSEVDTYIVQIELPIEDDNDYNEYEVEEEPYYE